VLADEHSDADCNTYGYGYPDGDQDSHSDRYSHFNGDANANGDSNRDPDFHRYRDGDCYADRNTNGYRDTNPDTDANMSRGCRYKWLFSCVLSCGVRWAAVRQLNADGHADGDKCNGHADYDCVSGVAYEYFDCGNSNLGNSDSDSDGHADAHRNSDAYWLNTDTHNDTSSYPVPRPCTCRERYAGHGYMHDSSLSAC
jgi:hypothetical protein